MPIKRIDSRDKAETIYKIQPLISKFPDNSHKWAVVQENGHGGIKEIEMYDTFEEAEELIKVLTLGK